MDSSDGEVLLETCCFLLNVVRSKSKEKGKEGGCRKYIYKNRTRSLP